MKSIFSLLLVGLLTIPTSGCTSATAASTQRAKEPDSSSAAQEDVSERLAENYKIIIDITEKELSSLSGEISMLPVQARPVTPQTEEICDNYLEKIDGYQTTITGFREQIDADEGDGDLEQEEYDALKFQCDQLDLRIETMRSALNVVFGAHLVENAA